MTICRSDKDTWYWHKKKLGHYLVKRSYLLIQEEKENSQTSDNLGFWRQLWNLKIPAKVKHSYGVLFPIAYLLKTYSEAERWMLI